MILTVILLLFDFSSYACALLNIFPQPFYIRNPQTGKLLTIEDGLCTSEQNLVIWPNSSLPWQQWMFNHDKSIESVFCPRMVIGTRGSSCSAGTDVVLSNKTRSLVSQTWVLQSDKTILVTSCNSNIDIYAGSSSDGTKVVLWNPTTGWNQKWETVNAPRHPTNSPTLSPVSVSSTASLTSECSSLILYHDRALQNSYFFGLTSLSSPSL